MAEAAPRVPQAAFTLGPIAYAKTEVPTVIGASAGTEATARPILTLPEVGYDGVTQVQVRFQAPAVIGDTAAIGYLTLKRQDTGVTLTTLGRITEGGASTARVGWPVHVEAILVPPAGSYALQIAAWRTTADVTISAGPGGAGSQFAPAFAMVESAIGTVGPPSGPWDALAAAEVEAIQVGGLQYRVLRGSFTVGPDPMVRWTSDTEGLTYEATQASLQAVRRRMAAAA